MLCSVTDFDQLFCNNANERCIQITKEKFADKSNNDAQLPVKCSV